MWVRGVLATALAVVSGAGCKYSSTPPGDDDDIGAPDGGGGPGEHDAAVRADAGSDTGDDAGVAWDAGADAGVGEVVTELLDPGISFGPRSAIDAAGQATVVWTNASGIVARRWEQAAWSDIEVLGDGDDPRLDVNHAGDGIVTWRDRVGAATAARIYAPGAGWLPQEAIGPGGNGYTGAVAIDGAGNVEALFDWSLEDSYRLKTVRYEPGTGWGEFSLIEAGQFITRMPDVAANEAGDFAGVWTHLGAGETVWAGRAQVGWAAPEQVGARDSAFYPEVAVDEDGDALVVFGNNDGLTYSVVTAWQPAGGSYEEPVVLGAADGSMTVSTSASSDGTFFVAWTSDSDASVARRDAVDGWEAPIVVDELGGETTTWNAISVAAYDGGAIVAWQQVTDGPHVFWCRYQDGHGWAAPTEIDPQPPGVAREVSVDAAPDGTAVIAWATREGDDSHVWAAIVPR